MKNPCPTCGGQGTVKSGHLLQICPACEGNGEDPGIERFFQYKFLTTPSLTALQVLTNQRIVISGDADFRIKMLMRRATGSFRIRLYDSSGHYFSSSGEGGTNDRVPDNCLFGDGQLPFLMVPYMQIPAGGFVAFDLEDTSNATNAIELVFTGAKVYPTPAN